MPEDFDKTQPKQGKKENTDSAEENDQRFESDSQKIVHRHLEDEDDVITDEDIRNVRVGMTPATMDAPTEARFEDDETLEDVEEKYIGKEADNDDQSSDDKSITPWDTIEPTK